MSHGRFMLVLLFLLSTGEAMEHDSRRTVLIRRELEKSIATTPLEAKGGEGGTKADRTKQRDECPRDHAAKPIDLIQSQPWNVTAELPRDLFMKHAGWTPDGSDRGIGVFTARSFKQGEDVGSALARVAPCVDDARVETPMGPRAIVCDIHFFDLPPADASILGENLAVFPSWMSFLNYPDDGKEAGLATGGNVDWAASVCSHPSGAPQWRLVATRDLAPQEELRLVYDDDPTTSWKMMKMKVPSPGPKLPSPGPKPPPKMMKKMKKKKGSL